MSDREFTIGHITDGGQVTSKGCDCCAKDLELRKDMLISELGAHEDKEPAVPLLEEYIAELRDQIGRANMLLTKVRGKKDA